MKSQADRCPRCNGTGQIAVAAFEAGERVLWHTGGWWGDKPATVLGMSRTAQRVRIKCDPHVDHNGGRPWITYVSLANVTRVNP